MKVMDSALASFRVSLSAREALLLALVAVIALTLPSSGAWAQSLKAGVEAGIRGDYATARKNFLPLAQQGNADAQDSMGILYLNGFGVPKNVVTARKWFRKAADQGHEDAQLKLGILYLDGNGVPKNFVTARKWIRKSADQGDRDAQLKLRIIYDEGLGVSTDRDEGWKWYYKAIGEKRDVLDPKVKAAWAAADKKIPKECITVSSRKGWQERHFSGGFLNWAKVRGSWSVDNARYAHVGPNGYSGADAKALDRFAANKADPRLPFGALLVRKGEHYISWRNFFNQLRQHRPAKLSATVLGFRINDTVLDDNHGSLTVCLQYSKP